MDLDTTIKNITKENKDLRDKINNLTNNHKLEVERLSKDKIQNNNELEHKRRLLKDYEREIKILEDDHHNFDNKDVDSNLNNKYFLELSELKKQSQQLKEFKDTLEKEIIKMEQNKQLILNEIDISSIKVQNLKNQLLNKPSNDHNCCESDSYKSLLGKINSELKVSDDLKIKISETHDILKEIRLEKEESIHKLKTCNDDLLSINTKIDENKKSASEKNNHLLRNMKMENIENLSKIDQNYILLKRKIRQCAAQIVDEKKCLETFVNNIPQFTDIVSNLEPFITKLDNLKKDITTNIKRLKYLEEKLSIVSIDAEEIHKYLNESKFDKEESKILTSSLKESQKNEIYLINELYDLRNKQITDSIFINEISRKLCELRIDNIIHKNKIHIIHRLKDIDKEANNHTTEVSINDVKTKERDHLSQTSTTIADLKDLAPSKINECHQQ